MGPDLENAIQQLSLRMRLIKAVQEDTSVSDNLSERDVLILDLLNQKGPMTVSEIALSNPNSSESTISTNITRLWRDKQMVSKTISPQNQRTTIVELTEKGRDAIKVFNRLRTARFKTLFDAINVTDEEKQILIRVIARAIPFFDKHLSGTKNISK